MYVHLQTRSCSACDSPRSVEVFPIIVDISVDEISLDWKAVACPCGYFSQVRHYAVSFNKWHSEKWSIEFDLKWAMTEAEKAKVEARLVKLGVVPIPDHLYVG